MDDMFSPEYVSKAKTDTPKPDATFPIEFRDLDEKMDGIAEEYGSGKPIRIVTRAVIQNE